MIKYSSQEKTTQDQNRKKIQATTTDLTNTYKPPPPQTHTHTHTNRRCTFSSIPVPVSFRLGRKLVLVQLLGEVATTRAVQLFIIKEKVQASLLGK